MDYALTSAVPFGRTRWRLIWFVFLPALAVAVTLLLLIANGIIAVSIAISGTTFKVTADRVVSTGTDSNNVGFYQYGVLDYTGSGTGVPQVENIIPHAQLVNMCQSVAVGPLHLRITAGGGGTPIKATNLIIDATALTAASAQFEGIQIGQDMGTFRHPALTQPTGRGSGPNVITGQVPTGTFGQVASSVTLSGVTQGATATSATSFTLPDLSLRFGASC